ncbi:centrosomal protein of 70 kDa-like [Lytechinus variegatus]|uniref:centrosomal protein of 70 kDa-like n=1 Tax=Lytechinus variegatus TaxID=7654 RepID=UPI001BB105EE|nr:centrosomal protein of 70 kDa-like [Lytechinus variegatus]XP_041459950.1 centrosomal protein of 70 kDa-like [Lytechinus variegatus]
MAKSLRREDGLHYKENREESEVFKNLAGLNRSILKGLVKLRGEPPISRTRELSLMLEEVMWHAQETRIILKEMQARAQMAPTSFQDRASQTPRRWKKDMELSKKQLGKMQQFADEVCSAVEDGSKQGLPVIGESRHKHETWCEQSYRHVVPTIQHWTGIILKDKHTDARSERQKKKDLFEAEKIVSHFQRLFDVPTREGSYARMTEVYHRLEELNNILHTLKSLLGLPDGIPANRVVVALGHLCDLHSDTSTKLLSHLLQTDNLERLILCLDQYHKFFPVFEGIAKDLMEILGVDSLGKVVPAVRALKLLHPY